MAHEEEEACGPSREAEGAVQSVAGVSHLDASSERLIRCSSQVYSAAVSSLASAALVYGALAGHQEGMPSGRSLRGTARPEV